jgi:hypothetical protein
MGRPKGSKNYDYTGSHSTGMKAARSANAYEGAGIPAKIRKEKREPDYGGQSRMGYSVYVEHQPSRNPRKSRPSGTTRSVGRWGW